MKIAINIKRIQFYVWIALGYLLLQLFIDLATQSGSFLPKIVNELWKLIYIVAINYLFYEFTLVKFNKKQFFTFFLLVILQIILCGVGLYAWRAVGINLHIYTSFKTYSSLEHAYSEHFGEGLFSVLFFGVTRHISNYIKLKQATQQLRIEKQEAELNYLKSQTNPHFLFNTLNNIYSLARDKSDLAPESILRLSKMLRFMLYEAGGEYIAIEQELKIMSDYIALEKLRYDESLRINFNHDIEDMKQAIPPLLLMPLVENAFKHGVAETRTDPYIHIHIAVKNRALKLCVKNSTDTVIEEKRVKENIGLSNLRRQLELLYKDYHLSIQQGEYEFTATLQINLASHV